MKKYISILLLLTMLLPTITACSTGAMQESAGAFTGSASTAGTDSTSTAENDSTSTTDADSSSATESASDDTPYDTSHVYIFANEEDASSWTGSQVDLSYEFGMLKLVPTGHDPILKITFSEEEQFSAEEYKYIAYRYKADCTQTQGIFYVSSTNHPSFSDKGMTMINVNPNNEWTDYVQKMTYNAYWKDTIQAIRIDPINGSTLDTSSVIYIDRIGFFKTQKEAYAFLEESTGPDFGTSVTIRSGKTKVFAPAGTLTEDYVQSDYLPADPDNAGSDGNLVCLEQDGQLTPVPVSYVNSVGFASYMAEMPGNYVTTTYKEAQNPEDADFTFVNARGIMTQEDRETESITRQQFFTALYNTMLAPKAGTTAPYTDIPADKSDIYNWIYTNELVPFADNTSSIEPDKPITRGEIAEAIGAYLTMLDAAPYADPDYVPTDCTLSEAGELACSSGILTVTDGKLSPEATITGDQLSSLFVRLIKAVLDQPILPSNFTEKETIRIGGWTNFYWPVEDADMKLFADAGLNLLVSTGDIEKQGTLQTVLNAGNKYGIEILRYNYSPWDFNAEDPQELPTSCYEYYDSPSYLGNHIFDEPGSDHYDMIADVTAYYNENMPGKMSFYNLLPMYANAAQLKFGASAADIDYYDADPDLYKKYVEAYAEKVPGDYICVDIYPNRVTNMQKSTYSDYLKNMDIFATACRKYDRDFWLYVQTTGLTGVRVPDYYDMRWQMYIGLAFGVDTFLHFTYTTYPTQDWTESMVTDGEPTDVYYAAQKANLEIMALSDDYVQYENVGAFSKNASHFKYAKFDNQYEDFDVLTSVTSKDPLLFGCFEAEEGDGYAFTVVNLHDLVLEKSATLQFTVEEGYNVSAWIRGEKKVLTPVNGTYSLDLECAEGVFVILEPQN